MNESTDVSLRDYIEVRINGVEDKLSALERFQEQHFHLNELAIKKAEDSMTLRLDSLNEFRSQLREERADLATRESLEGVIIRMEKLENQASQSVGKSEGISASWVVIEFIILIAISLAGLVVAITR